MRSAGARPPSGSVRVDATVLALPDGRHLAYAEYGDPDGDPVIGFHGTPGGRHQLAPLDEDARRVGVRLVVPDRPGYGDSDLVTDRSLTDWPDDVAALAGHLGLDRFALLGISGGGPHALACAAALGDRVTATAVVSGVAPFGWDDVAEALPLPLRPIAALVLRTPLLGALIGLGLWLLRTYPRRVFAAYRHWFPPGDVAVLERPGLVELYLAGARRTSPTAARAAVQDLRLFTRPWHVDLAAIQTPVHVWHGDADKNVPVAHGRWTAAQVTDGTFHLCQDGGHLCVVDWAAQILHALRTDVPPPEEDPPRGGEQLPPDWDASYVQTPPWDIGRPQAPFVELADAGHLRGAVLELGCGTGEHTLLAAERGLDATGIDIAPTAIDQARAKARQRGLSARFLVGDALDVDRLGETFDVVIDSGFFHVLTDEARERLAEVLRRVMAPDAAYHLLCFSDRVPGDAGPRRIRQEEIRSVFADGFSVDGIRESYMEATFLDVPVPAWLARITRDA